MIYVSKPFTPPIEEYITRLKPAFEASVLTNGGELNQELETRLKEHLGVDNLLLLANGTLALQVAYKVLGISGKVLTTPFSFNATCSSMTWQKLTPVFCDIDNRTLNISTNSAYALDSDVSAIVPVHVFGNPCDTEEISKLAGLHDLKTIYDASHAFGIRGPNGESLLNEGDISTLSFHATKLFHTAEGGALVSKNAELIERARELINFGISSNGLPTPSGINAKMSELHAAMGLCVLDHFDEIKLARKELYEYYTSNLDENIVQQVRREGYNNNYAYFPAIFPSSSIRALVETKLQSEGVIARRYFHPSLDTIHSTTQTCPTSQGIAERILCLPLYAGLSLASVKKITKLVNKEVSLAR